MYNAEGVERGRKEGEGRKEWEREGKTTRMRQRKTKSRT